MQARISLGDLKSPQDIRRLERTLEELYDLHDTLYTDTAPNGSISAHRGKIALYLNGSTYEKWINTDGDTAWSRIDADADTQMWETDGGDAELKTADDIDMQNMQIKGMCIENRTNDTGCTQTGRIWFRTDV